jgi:threonine dehydrogenase-like Zn-dependent dehydrogenase
VIAIGGPLLPGAQAEYVKLPMADNNLFLAPAHLPLDMLVLMADVIPTGFQAARNARAFLDVDEPEPTKEGVCVVVGCGPVSSTL